MGCEQSAPVVEDANAIGEKVASTTCCENGSKEGFKFRKNTCALEYWEPLRLLGEGSISSIHLVRRRPYRVDVPYSERADVMRAADAADISSAKLQLDALDPKDLFALKSIMKDHVQNDKYLEEMRSEIYTMSRLCHPNVIDVFEAFERKRHIYLIMEYCRGGNLCERKTTEAEAATIVRKILSAVAYMHEHSVVHRDLKLENIMFDKDPTTDPSAEIKIIDYGLATKFLSNEYKKMTARVGTLYCMAPQVLQGMYDSKCDLWSVGVISYMLLSCGLNPFWGPPRQVSWEQRKRIMIDRIMRCEYMKMSGPSWQKISPEAKEFVQSLLQMEPQRRPTATEALRSPWIVKYQDYKMKGRLAQADHYSEKQELQRKAKVMLAESLPDDQIVHLKRTLQEKDPKMEDLVSIHDFRRLLFENSHLDKRKVESLFEGTELDMDESINYIGMFAGALDRKMRKQEEFVVNLFQRCGKDADCKIEKEQMRILLKESSEGADAFIVSALDAIIDDLAGGDDRVSCQDILHHVHQLEMQRMNAISSCHSLRELDGTTVEEVAFNDDAKELADETNTVIPGGRSIDPNEKPKFIYDDGSKSIRKYHDG